jgi:alpha-beta hydrolase superfamily lysophospholipase
MKHIEGNFKGVRNANIYYQAWLPDGDVKAVLFLVHGLGEHSGRYMNHVDHFVPLGYAVYGLDHVGHGKSGGQREVIDRFSDYTGTLRIYYEMVKGWRPGKPIVVLAHSMGALIACDYILDHPADFKGAILSAPPIVVGDDFSPFILTMARVLSVIAPKAGVSKLDTAAISHDPEVVKAYENDPLVFHEKTPARLGGEMLKTIARINAEVGKITLPFITVQGSKDLLANPGGSQMLYDKAGSKDKTLKVYEGLFHEVHNEPEREVMFKDVESWLAAHV